MKKLVKSIWICLITILMLFAVITPVSAEISSPHYEDFVEMILVEKGLDLKTDNVKIVNIDDTIIVKHYKSKGEIVVYSQEISTYTTREISPAISPITILKGTILNIQDI